MFKYFGSCFAAKSSSKNSQNPPKSSPVTEGNVGQNFLATQVKDQGSQQDFSLLSQDRAGTPALMLASCKGSGVNFTEFLEGLATINAQSRELATKEMNEIKDKYDSLKQTIENLSNLSKEFDSFSKTDEYIKKNYQGYESQLPKLLTVLKNSTEQHKNYLKKYDGMIKILSKNIEDSKEFISKDVVKCVKDLKDNIDSVQGKIDQHHSDISNGFEEISNNHQSFLREKFDEKTRLVSKDIKTLQELHERGKTIFSIITKNPDAIQPQDKEKYDQRKKNTLVFMKRFLEAQGFDIVGKLISGDAIFYKTKDIIGQSKIDEQRNKISSDLKSKDPKILSSLCDVIDDFSKTAEELSKKVQGFKEPFLEYIDSLRPDYPDYDDNLKGIRALVLSYFGDDSGLREQHPELYLYR